ncbi:hypothetical protein L1I30_13420 [Gillisia sp. M10.2A]|uniref:Capsule polysaccharide biosynthesis protein n=1 Tax=Gillisia lutea TaxID=2909668 RepID=A0ABS9EIM1_9FLAO|nr:hypothetical protein [Gillisia lutea]MCF4102671.1 hypothetical protein [Gillisia lutea]
MKIFIASIYNIDSYSRGIMPDVLQDSINKYSNATIYYLSCYNSFDVCYFNPDKKPDICYRCKTGAKNTLRLVNGEFTDLSINDIVTNEDKNTAINFYRDKSRVSFNDVYDEFEVGASTLSTYISITRDRDLFNADASFVKELAINALSLYLGLYRFFKSNEIDVVYNFNARQEYVRAVLNASLKANIDCYNVERARMGGFIETYKNVLPHNISTKWKLVQDCWSESRLSVKEKEIIGSSFYDRQGKGESIIFQSYTSNMEKGSLPPYILGNKKNLVLFNSSDDEFAAMGEEFQNPFFKNQNEGLDYLVHLVGSKLQGYNLIIRMHPNLSGVTHKFVEQIKELHQLYPNIYVVPPESKIDTYALMDTADKVISFGSTTGLEANYRNIPVILLGKSFYFYANVAYIPTKKEDLEDLLSQDLQLKPRIDALKFGFYYLRGGSKTQYYFEDNKGKGVFFKTKRIHFFTLKQRIKNQFIKLMYQFFKMRIRL